jgi:putative endonuclease
VKQYYVYIMASKKNGTLYVGITGDLIKRVYEHRHGLVGGFTKKYRVTRLVHYEVFDDPQQAIAREKRIKKWYREWKINLIKTSNPQWRDLYSEIAGDCGSPPTRG